MALDPTERQVSGEIFPTSVEIASGTSGATWTNLQNLLVKDGVATAAYVGSNVFIAQSILFTWENFPGAKNFINTVVSGTPFLQATGLEFSAEIEWGSNAESPEAFTEISWTSIINTNPIQNKNVSVPDQIGSYEQFTIENTSDVSESTQKNLSVDFSNNITFELQIVDLSHTGNMTLFLRNCTMQAVGYRETFPISLTGAGIN